MSASKCEPAVIRSVSVPLPHGIPEHLTELTIDEHRRRFGAALDHYFTTYPPAKPGEPDFAIEVWILEAALKAELDVSGMTLPQIWALLRAPAVGQ